MSDKERGQGSCLCGAIRFVARAIDTHFATCHCGMCRKWTGGPLFAVDCGSDVSFEGEENIALFSSSEWAERGFCRQCGTHLFYRVKESQQYFIPVGLFDNPQDFVFEQQIFIDEKPDYYDFANDTTNLTGEEVFAQFAPPDE